MQEVQLLNEIQDKHSLGYSQVIFMQRVSYPLITLRKYPGLH